MKTQLSVLREGLVKATNLGSWISGDILALGYKSFSIPLVFGKRNFIFLFFFFLELPIFFLQIQFWPQCQNYFTLVLLSTSFFDIVALFLLQNTMLVVFCYSGSIAHSTTVAVFSSLFFSMLQMAWKSKTRCLVLLDANRATLAKSSFFMPCVRWEWILTHFNNPVNPVGILTFKLVCQHLNKMFKTHVKCINCIRIYCYMYS